MTAHVARTIRVVIVDGQPLFRAGLARLILQDNRLQLAAELHDGRSALETIRRLEPDVAVLDVDVPELDGRRVLNAVVREGLVTRVVLLTADRRPEAAFEAMAAGAHGYLSKRAEGEAVREAIRRVAAGGIVLCQEMQTLVAAQIQLRHRDHAGLLTARERDVLVLISEGLSAPEIGRRLHVAPTTVRGYVARIYERLGVGERAQAVAEGMRRGLLD
jgi:two-component system nitrate/nitrite response regulator NarL